MEIINLSGLIENDLWTYGPPNPDINIKKISSIEQNGCSISSINMSILTGSYLETGRHIFKNYLTIDEISEERFVSSATVINLPKSELEPITKIELNKNKKEIYKNNTLLINTGWDKNWNKEGYFNKSPHFTLEAMEWILNSPVNLLGADIPSYNKPKNAKVNVLKTYYQKKENMIVAPLINIGKIYTSTIKFIVAPINLKNVCAAPARALAIL